MQEHSTLNVAFQPEGVHGGPLLAVRSSECIAFYDWDCLKCVRRVDVAAESVSWNAAGDMLALVCKENVYILKYCREVVVDTLKSDIYWDEAGMEEAFQVVAEVWQQAVDTALTLFP